MRSQVCALLSERLLVACGWCLVVGGIPPVTSGASCPFFKSIEVPAAGRETEPREPGVPRQSLGTRSGKTAHPKFSFPGSAWEPRPGVALPCAGVLSQPCSPARSNLNRSLYSASKVLACSARVGYVRPRLCWVVTRERGWGQALGMDTGSDLQALIATHERRLVGWFRSRVVDGDIAEELAQRTWQEVLRHGHTFDPQRGAFFTFTKVWAEIILKRQRTEVALRRRREIGLEAEGEEDDAVDPILRTAAQLQSYDVVDLDHERVFMGLLALTLSCRRLPHEILAFGFVKLLDWKPARVVAELSDELLDRMSALMADEYTLDVATQDVRPAFAGLHHKLQQTLAQVDADPRAKKPYSDLMNERTGGTLLRAYYREVSTPEMAVVRWWSAVARALVEKLVVLREGPIAEWIEDYCDSFQKGGRS